MKLLCTYLVDVSNDLHGNAAFEHKPPTFIKASCCLFVISFLLCLLSSSTKLMSSCSNLEGSPSVERLASQATSHPISWLFNHGGKLKVLNYFNQ